MRVILKYVFTIKSIFLNYLGHSLQTNYKNVCFEKFFIISGYFENYNFFFIYIFWLNGDHLENWPHFEINSYIKQLHKSILANVGSYIFYFMLIFFIYFSIKDGRLE